MILSNCMSCICVCTWALGKIIRRFNLNGLATKPISFEIDDKEFVCLISILTINAYQRVYFLTDKLNIAWGLQVYNFTKTGNFTVDSGEKWKNGISLLLGHVTEGSTEVSPHFFSLLNQRTQIFFLVTVRFGWWSRIKIYGCERCHGRHWRKVFLEFSFETKLCQLEILFTESYIFKNMGAKDCNLLSNLANALLPL